MKLKLLLIASILAMTSSYSYSQQVMRGETSPGTYTNVSVDVAGALKVTGASVTSGAVTDRSGTLITGGTSQQIMATKSTRKYLMIQNISDTVMWCNFAIAAVQDQPSFRIAVGDSFVMESSVVSNESIHCIGATSGKAFVSKEM